MSDTVRSANLISAEQLLTELSAAATDLVVLDVRQSLSASSDQADPEAYLSGHIPGALFADLDTDLAGVSTGANGRRPLPRPEDFEKSVRRWGIDVSTPVVVYGATRHRPRRAHGGCFDGRASNPCDFSTVAWTRPARLGDLGLKHRRHDRHPGGHTHRHQPLPRGAGKGLVSDCNATQLTADPVHLVTLSGSKAPLAKSWSRRPRDGGALPR